MNDAKKAIAYMFRVLGKKQSNADELALLLSVKLRWFPPKDAHRFIELCTRLGLLVLDEDKKLKPTFNTTLIHVPIDFVPPPTIIEDLSTIAQGAASADKAGLAATAATAEHTTKAAQQKPRPSLNIAATREKFFMSVVEEIEKIASASKKSIISEINKMQEELGVEVEVAALMIAERYGIDVKKAAKKAYALLVSSWEQDSKPK